MEERTIFVTEVERERLAHALRSVPEQPRGTRADLLELREELDRAQVVRQPDETPRNVVTINSQVKLTDLDWGTGLSYTLVFPAEANIAKERISVLSPLGAALLGRRVRDAIEVAVPGGKRRLLVRSILKGKREIRYAV